jgi:hypothetical protein
MHWANLRATANCLGLRCALKEPGGCSSLHAWSAFIHTAGVTPIPKLGNSPDAFGSGKSGYPFSRMHAANCTAFSRAVAFLLPPVLVLLALLVPLLLLLPPQPAPITTTIASMASAASGRSVLLMGSPLVC